MDDLQERVLGGSISCAVFIFVVLPWSAATLYLDYLVGRTVFNSWKTSYFAETIGTVTRSAVADKSGEFEIRYDYIVNGEQYTGDKYKLSFTETRPNHTLQLAAKYPVGKDVPVYYCPGQPHLSQLCKGFDVRDFCALPFLILFNGVTLMIIYNWLPRSIDQRLFRNKEHWFQDFRIYKDDSILRLQISSYTPVLTAIIGTLPACFFAILLTTLGQSDVVDFWLGCGMILLGGWLGFWLAVWWNRSDLYYLIVDQFHRELTLPRQPDKTPGLVVPFDTIEKITFSTIEQAEWNNNILTLHYRSEGDTKSAIIASKHNCTGLNFSEEELTALKHWILCETGRNDC